MGILVRAATLSELGLKPPAVMVCPRKSAVVAPILALVGESLRRLFAQAFEKGSDVGGVVGRGGIEDDDVVEVCGDPLQAFDDLVDDLDEPAGGGAAALRHYKPSEEPVGGAERLQWDGVLVDRDLVKEETRSKREKMWPLPKESRTSSTWGMGSCPRDLMAFSFL